MSLVAHSLVTLIPSIRLIILVCKIEFINRAVFRALQHCLRLLATAMANSDLRDIIADEDKKFAEIGSEDKSVIYGRRINQNEANTPRPPEVIAASEVITITRLLAARSAGRNVAESFEADFMEAIEAILSLGVGAEVMTVLFWLRFRHFR